MTEGTENKEIEITSENFNKYFKDVRVSKLEKDEVIAKYSAIAEFVDGGEKRQIISLLTDTENKMEATIQVMRKLLFASEQDAYRVPREMAEDLISGLSIEDIAKKPYKYTLEMFFYTRLENIPKDDPHWCCISVLNFDDFKSKEFSYEQNEVINKKMKESIKSNLLSDEENEKLNKEIEQKKDE
jgi:hypothetical protein